MFSIRDVTLAQDAVEYVIGALAVNSRLRAVRFRGTRLQGKPIRDIFAMVRANPSVEELDLYKNPFAGDELSAVAAALPHTRLRRLVLSRTELGAAAIRELSTALAQPQCTLEELDLSHNRPGADGAAALAQALRDNKRLCKLNLNACRIPIEGIHALTQAFAVNGNISFLILSHNRLNNVSVAQLMLLPQLLVARLSHCQLTESEAVDLSSALARVSGPPSPVASSSSTASATAHSALPDPSDVSSSALSERLPCSSLTVLDLSFNLIKDGGAVALAGALRANHTVTSVDLSENSIRDEGVRALCAMLLVNTTVRELKLKNNLAHRESLPQFAKVLAGNANATLTSLHIDSCLEAVRAVSTALTTNTTLTKLYFSVHPPGTDWRFGDEGALALKAALEVNRSLTKISLAQCAIGPPGLKALSEVLAVNPVLCSIDLTGSQHTPPPVPPPVPPGHNPPPMPPRFVPPYPQTAQTKYVDDQIAFFIAKNKVNRLGRPPFPLCAFRLNVFVRVCVVLCCVASEAASELELVARGSGDLICARQYRQSTPILDLAPGQRHRRPLPQGESVELAQITLTLRPCGSSSYLCYPDLQFI